MGSLFDLSAWISELPSECPIDDEIAAWHLTPKQHILEWTISTAVFTYFLITCWKREEIHVKFKRRAERHYPRLQQHKQTTQSSRFIDILVAIALIASLSLIFYHKWMKSRVWFMTQPCYALHTLLLVIMLFPPGSVYGSLLFNIYLHLLFSPFLGLVGANTSVYKQFLEYENWFVEHALLLVTPLVFIYTHRFVLVRGFNFLLMSFSIEVLYHSLILLPGSFISGLNLNYVMCPPAGLLASFDYHYRWVMTLIFCPILMIIIRYGLVEAFIRLVYANAYLDDVETNPSVVEKSNKKEHKTVTQTFAKPATTEGNGNTNTSSAKKRIEIEYENEDDTKKVGVTTRSASLKKRSKRADD